MTKFLPPSVVLRNFGQVTMWDGEARLSTLSKRHLNWLNSRLKRCDEDRSVLYSVTNKIGRLPSSVAPVSNPAPAKFNDPISKMADLPSFWQALVSNPGPEDGGTITTI